jgi:intracellular sulfur oxidation DsrE/DsrF family protein
MIKTVSKLGLLSLMLIWSAGLLAADYRNTDVDRLLKSSDEPDGVVFELISWDEKTWSWAAPMITDLRQQLRQRFPNIDIAIVSHGGEQFQLTYSRQDEQPEAIAQLTDLTKEGVYLHVCGTHSQWNDVPEEAYLDIVDVSPSGPAQINDYIRLGYTHILLRQPQP